MNLVRGHRRRAVRRLDEQLEFGLSQYALAGRDEWLDRLLTDCVVVETIAGIAAETGEPLSALQARARRAAREIVPFFSAVLYFRVGYWLARWYLRTLYRVSAEFADRDALAAIGRDCCVVLVSNHRSNLDPFMLIYLASRRTAISYSAGEWALAWPFRYLLHAIGFYIVRRDARGDRLQRTLVQRYVYLATSHCVPQGLFLEGGLSRDGNMLPLKLGLLSYLLQAHGRENCRDIVFVPVGLSYDRIPEDKTLLAHRAEGFDSKGSWYGVLSFLRFIVLAMPRMIGLVRPFGKVVANFGVPLSVAQWQAESGNIPGDEDTQQQRGYITGLGEHLRDSIQRLIPILAVSIISDVLLRTGSTGISESRLQRQALAMAQRLRAAGAPVAVQPDSQEEEFADALYLMRKRHLVVLGAEERLRSSTSRRPLLEYYRNAIPVELRFTCPESGCAGEHA